MIFKVIKLCIIPSYNMANFINKYINIFINDLLLFNIKNKYIKLVHSNL